MKIGNSNFANTNEPSTDSLHSWDRQHQLQPWAAMDAWREYDHMLVEMLREFIYGMPQVRNS